ncbi:Predicted transposase YdaD [Dyadobacter sp. SG02]|uniref:hypothetical protein n=1 Tax=Dyadobacter sp. SG02 TaxID=1855291 RepID=UPI0008C57700|nr:hypothetical protein [Dyadobacter sp. SG02]SEI37746.1 Predicted transposase YdaD [Dyadobacter sp. SG02]
MKRDDTLWKSILEDIFEDFLLFFYPDAGTFFDFSKGFEYLDKELEQLFPPEDHYQTRFVDKLVKVYCKNGDNEWILVHIEVQGYRDPNFSRRMFTYYSRILDKYDKPITAFAIFTENNAAFRPCEYYREFLGTSVLFRYNVFKILDQDEQMLGKSDNPFAIVALTVKAALKSKSVSETDLLRLKIQLAKNLLDRNLPKSKINNLLTFVRFYIHFENQDTRFKFEQAIDQITQNKQTMGIQEFITERFRTEGKAEGRAEGRTELMAMITHNLLHETSLSIEKIAELVGASTEFVLSIKQGKYKDMSLE